MLLKRANTRRLFFETKGSNKNHSFTLIEQKHSGFKDSDVRIQGNSDIVYGKMHPVVTPYILFQYRFNSLNKILYFESVEHFNSKKVCQKSVTSTRGLLEEQMYLMALATCNRACYSFGIFIVILSYIRK